MRSEKGNFRSALFGGFNRRDVIEYVTTLAAERNGYKLRVEEMESKLDDLGERLAFAEEETAAANRRTEEIRIAAIDDALTVLCELEEKYTEVCSDMGVTANHVKWELGKMGDGLSLIASVLDSAGKRFAELREIVQNMKNGDEGVLFDEAAEDSDREEEEKPLSGGGEVSSQDAGGTV